MIGPNGIVNKYCISVWIDNINDRVEWNFYIILIGDNTIEKQVDYPNQRDFNLYMIG